MFKVQKVWDIIVTNVVTGAIVTKRVVPDAVFLGQRQWALKKYSKKPDHAIRFKSRELGYRTTAMPLAA